MKHDKLDLLVRRHLEVHPAEGATAGIEREAELAIGRLEPVGGKLRRVIDPSEMTALVLVPVELENEGAGQLERLQHAVATNPSDDDARFEYVKALLLAGRADDAEHQEAVFAAVGERFGDVDLLVNNTGINPAYGRLVDLDLDVARKIVEVNCIAALSWVQKAVAHGFESRGGAIVNVSSVAGVRPAPGIGFYGASKAMLTHLTEELAGMGAEVDLGAIEGAFVEVAASYSKRQGISYAAWREVGVPAAVLKRAGISRSA